MSNSLTGVDTKLYYAILKVIPNLHIFLTKNNIVLEYVLCLNYYNKGNKGTLPFNYSFIQTDPKSVINWSFDWVLGNNMLKNNSIKAVNWGMLHTDFYINYHLYNNITFNNIRMI